MSSSGGPANIPRVNRPSKTTCTAGAPSRLAAPAATALSPAGHREIKFYRQRMVGQLLSGLLTLLGKLSLRWDGNCSAYPSTFE